MTGEEDKHIFILFYLQRDESGGASVKKVTTLLLVYFVIIIRPKDIFPPMDIKAYPTFKSVNY